MPARRVTAAAVVRTTLTTVTTTALTAAALTACAGAAPRVDATEAHRPQTPGAASARPGAAGAAAPRPPGGGLDGGAPASPPAVAAPPAAPAPERAPLPGDELLALRVEGLPDQLVSLPSGPGAAAGAGPGGDAGGGPAGTRTGSRGRHAVLLALHGWGDQPEWECPIWREIVNARVFVLCPRGVPAEGGGFTWQSAAHLERAVERGLAALVATWPEHVDAERPLLTGFSLGAIWGRALFARDPSRWSGAVLVEGGFEAPPVPAWSGPAAAGAAAPGELPRVLFVCGQWGCEQRSRALARRLATRAAIEVVALRVGHTYGGPVSRAIEGAWGHVARGDPRFARE